MSKLIIEGQALPNMPWEERPQDCKNVIETLPEFCILDLNLYYRLPNTEITTYGVW